MKKSKFMRVAAILMAAVLLTTCAISGTFAKYVTSGSRAAEEARVAKWGVTITGSSDPLFNTTYATDDTDVSATIAQSVTSSNSDKVVAPGTTGTLNTFSIAGTPEVAFKVTYTGTLTLTGWTTDGTTEYCPLVITVNGTDYSIDGTTIADVAALQTAVNNAFAGLSQNYGPNTTVAATASQVTWSWPFTGNDVNDTALGDRAADGNAATISFAATATVTQID